MRAGTHPKAVGSVPTGAAEKRLSARVSRVLRLCPIFRAQPGGVPTGSSKPDVAPPGGSVAGTPSTEEGHLRAISDREQSRKRRSRINGWRRNRRFSCSQQPAVRTVSRGCAGAAIGACLEEITRGWHQESRKRSHVKGFWRAAPQIGGL